MNTSSPTVDPSSADIGQVFLSYLKSKGYKNTEAILFKEMNGLPTSDIYQQLDQTHDSQNDDDPITYDISYRNLREWIENSLDWYKSELRSVLFPIFVHAYLDLVVKQQQEEAAHLFSSYKHDHVELHTPDLNRLQAIKEPHHVHENELAQLYRSNKYSLLMSSVPFELFLNYLQDNRYMRLLRLVNQYINIQVVQGKLLKSAGGLELDDVVGITGHRSQDLAAFNQQPVQLGHAPMEHAFKDEVEYQLRVLDDANSHKAERPPGDHFEPPATSLVDLFKKTVQEESVNGPPVADIPLPSRRGPEIQAQVDAIRDMAKRLPLGSDSLPSICCFTFHNTYHTLNCLRLTRDASMVAGGFSDSFIKIWSLNGEKLRGFRNTINPVHINDALDLNRHRERTGSDFKKLVGHAGPVFGVSFSPDNQYLISCSADKTARLWSTQTFTNLVTFKGHNSPIWDVEFGPFGFYFATASHDRTARLWCVDQIYPLRIFAGHLSDVDVVRFHPNSKYLFTGSSDRTVRMWDILTGETVRVFTGHRDPIKALAVSPNGKWLATGGDDYLVMLWDLATGKRIKTMTGHSGPIYSLAFSRDNTVLVSGGMDDTVRVWNVDQEEDSTIPTVNGFSEAAKEKKIVESHDQLAMFPTKHTPVYDIQFTNRNLCLMAGSFNPPR
ncbi:WD40 repeat-like protein [Hesseltinella vesiculosa]|uniref:WD40 repeat-like protein n=1 Tax=Hesseltinella vesiculosa TaxID=101127 RepID=A0A1X2GSU9_9FUNG|nr:WD40 repeat-like protein [Hesseltinella vesiculosa]